MECDEIILNKKGRTKGTRGNSARDFSDTMENGSECGWMLSRATLISGRASVSWCNLKAPNEEVPCPAQSNICQGASIGSEGPAIQSSLNRVTENEHERNVRSAVGVLPTSSVLL